MSLVITNGASLDQCSRTSHGAFLEWTTDAFSTASSGSCVQVRLGVICQTAMVPPRLATTALFAGDGLPLAALGSVGNARYLVMNANKEALNRAQGLKFDRDKHAW